MTDSLKPSVMKSLIEPDSQPDSQSDSQSVTAELAETYVGNLHEQPAIAEQVAQAQKDGRCWAVTIERSDRLKGRILTHTASGQPIGIVKGRDWRLRDGDVLMTALGNWVVISIQAQLVMALRFEPGASNQAIALVHLGHVLGNHHWPITVQNGVIYVELAAEAAVMAQTVRAIAQTLELKGLQVNFEERSADKFLDFSQKLSQDSPLNLSHSHHHHDHH